MLLLTLTQPWATLVALGEKRIETRSWAPHAGADGELIAVHAAKTFGGLRGIRLPGSSRNLPLSVDGLASLCDRWPFADVLYGTHGVGYQTRRRASAALPGSRAIGKAIAAELPLGAVVAVAVLRSWHPTEPGLLERELHHRAAPHEAEFGDYSDGRWAWLLEGARPLSRPYGMRGQRGLQSVPEADRDAIMTLVDLDPPQPQEAA
jgi:hypothetical protein